MDENQNQGLPPSAPAPSPVPAPAPDQSGTGYLIVHVTTARGAIPIEGAQVDIRTYEEEASSNPATRGDVVASLTSGRDGNTTRIPLSTPPAGTSERPGSVRPFALYQADVFAEGYRRQSYLGIPVFDGITSLQPAVLVPLPEDGSGGTAPAEPLYFPESGYPNL